MSDFKATASVPTGWTDQRDYLGIDYYWTGKDSILGMLQDDYGIPDVTPIITRRRDTGDIMFLVQSAPKNTPNQKTYYVWNGIANVVCRIDGQKDLNSIYTAMEAKKGALGGLKLVRVYEKA